MVDACMGYLKGRVAAALGNDKLGAPPQVYTALQTLKTCVNPHVGAVMVREDTLTRSGRPLRNLATGQDDLQLFDRSVTFDVVIGEESTERLAAIFDAFLVSLDRGLTHQGHYIAIELPEPADWVDKKDSVINAEIAVELPVVFRGGVYKTQTFKQLADVAIEREDTYGK